MSSIWGVLIELSLRYLAYTIAIFLGGYHVVMFIIKVVYPLDVALHEVRGASMKVRRDFGRIKNTKGVQMLELLRAKKTAPIPRLDHLYPLSKKRDYLTMVRDANGNIFPAKIGSDAHTKLITVDPDFHDVNRWHVQEHKEKEQKYSKLSFMEKWGGYIALIVVGVVCFLMIYISTTYLTTSVNDFSASFQGFTETLKALTNELAGGS